MGKAKWLVMALGGLIAGNAFAEDRGEMQITPFVGYSRLRVDGVNLLGGETKRVDQLMSGVSAGYKTPFGVVVEIGTADAFHEDIFGNDNFDFNLDTDFATVGYQLDFGRGWRFVPKFGRQKWKLMSDDRELLDSLGSLHETVRGYDNYWEASLMRHLSESIALGVNFKDIDAKYGHSRSGVFVFTFGF